MKSAAVFKNKRPFVSASQMISRHDWMGYVQSFSVSSNQDLICAQDSTNHARLLFIMGLRNACERTPSRVSAMFKTRKQHITSRLLERTHKGLLLRYDVGLLVCIRVFCCMSCGEKVMFQMQHMPYLEVLKGTTFFSLCTFLYTQGSLPLDSGHQVTAQ